MTCPNCGAEVRAICAEHMACFACHHVTMRNLMREKDNAYAWAKQIEAKLTGDGPYDPHEGEPQPKQRTWGDRVIGSMWNPNDPKERDDIKATNRSIERFLGFGG